MNSKGKIQHLGLHLEDLAVMNYSTYYSMSDRKVAVLGKMYGKDWEEFLFQFPKHLLQVSEIPSLESHPFVLKNKAAPLQASSFQRPWEVENH